MKKIILLVLFIANYISAQELPCSTFDNGGTDNWVTTVASASIASPNTLDGSNYLRINDASGSSSVTNSVGYTFLGEIFNDGTHCLCFDYKVFNDGVSASSVPIPIRLIVYGIGGQAITFESSFTVTENDDWIKVCAPIALCDSAGNLPSNDQGQWIVPAGQDCSYFNNVILNTTAIRFYIDVAGSSAQTEIIGIDNICVTEGCNQQDPEPTEAGAYCCESENIIHNGNFEYGNENFTSAYSYQASLTANSVLPGEYSVVNTTEANTVSSQWLINDHTFCVDGTNSKFMVVNGKTQQPAGSESMIYQQQLNLEFSQDYKLCLNLKNLPQCAFDVIPRIRIQLVGANWTSDSGYQGGFIDVNTSNDACDWLNISGCITKSATKYTAIRIFLAEDGNGDGNDLAIDDVSVQKKLDQNLSITVLHQGTGNQITGSLNGINTADDVLPAGDVCADQNQGNQYYWYIAEASSISPLTLEFSTFAWSSNVSGFNFGTGLAVTPVWDLTSTFSGYTFESNKLYFIGLYVPSCCESCYQEEWVYQLTFNSQRTSQPLLLTPEMKEKIKAMFKMGDGLTNNLEDITNPKEVVVYPNPSKDFFNINFEKSISGECQVIDINGREIKTKLIEKETKTVIDLSLQPKGIYFLKITTDEKVFYEKIFKD